MGASEARSDGGAPRGIWVRTYAIEEFRARTIPVVAAEPVANTAFLTVFDRLCREGPHAFGERDPEMLTWYGPDGAVDAAMLRTPAYGYLLAGDPGTAGVAAFVDLLLDPAAGLDGREINLPGACEHTFAEAWAARTGKPARVGERNRLYRLAEPRDPDPLRPGRARLAESGDVAVVTRYLLAFFEEVEHPPPDVTAAAEQIAAARIAEGNFVLWLDADDTPVSMAGFTPIVAGTARIGPVYTPRELRGRGYAGGVTAAAGRELLERGAAEVVLFTDLANPTSNALYQRIGYRPVSDRVRLQLPE